MKFTLKTETLKKWLEIVNHATTWITTTPILENILLKANYNNLVLTSNNLEIAIEYIINKDIKIDIEWSICIPSKLFTNYIWLLDDDEVKIELKSDNSIQIITETWKVQIKWTPSWEFPLIPSIKEDISLNIESKVLKRGIEKTLFSSAEWNIRPTLAWILVNIKWQNIDFASTDSFRLSEYQIKIKSSLKETFSQIIPSKTVFELKSILKDEKNVKIMSWENQIAFFFWNTKFYSRLLNGKFPDYSTFFPKSYSSKIEINRIDLIQALKKINLLSKENNYSIKMSLSVENWVLLETSQTQIWEWEVRLKWAIEWEDNIIWINSIYFLEALTVIESSHVSISFENPLSPILIKPLDTENKKMESSRFKHIIMPLKI